jgi:PAS domain S-box-containing protein
MTISLSIIRAAKYLALIGLIAMDGVYAENLPGADSAIAMNSVYAENLPGASSAIAMDDVNAASHMEAGAAIADANSVSAEPIHLQLRWHHQFQFAGYYAAIEKGYYRKAGLEVIAHEGAPGKTPVQEVLHGHAQYGEANSELLLERLRGAPLVALAAIYQHSPSILLARKDAGILSPEDLIGKKVMMLNQALDADFVAMFTNESIDINRIQIIPSSYEIQDLVDGKVAAFNSYISNEPYFLKQQGIEYTALNPRNYGVDFYSDILFTSEEEIKRHPERVKAFREASLEGWRYAMEHPQEIIDLLINKYHVSKSRAHLEFEAEAMRTLILPDLMEMGHMNPWRWRHMAETFIKAGMVENDNFLQGFIFDPDPVADRKILVKYSRISAIFALITSLIALILYAAYRSVKRENRQRIAIAAELSNRTSELELHNRILRQINQGVPLHAILDELLRQIETLHPGMLCSILLLNEDGRHLQHIAAPSLPDFYNQAINGLEIGAGIGSCGTAAYLGERVIVEDIQQHPYWESLRDLARQAGLQACWSQPIKNSAGEVLGTFSIYHQQPSRPSDNELALIGRYANLVLLVIKRKQTENALQSSEERFKIIFNQAPLGIALVDSLSGYFYTANPMFAKIVGRTLDEIPTINWMNITHPDDVQEGLNNIALLNTGKINDFQMQKRYLHPDGSVVWIKMTIASVETGDKAHPRHLCMIEDITARKKEGEALRESEDRLRSIYDLDLIGLAITSPEKGWIRINDYLCKMLEYSEPELRGMTWAQLTYPEDLAADVQQFERLLGNEIDRYALEKRFISRNGKIIPARLVVQCVRKQDGSVNYVTSMIEDITESKQVENTLRESAEQLRFVLEGSQLGFWDWNLSTNVVKRSNLWAGILGYTLDEIESTKHQWADFIHPDDQCNAWKSITDHLEGQTPLHELTYRMKTKNGTYKWILDRARIVQRDSDGQPIRMCGTHADVTEQKNIEDALRESESRFRNLYEKAPLAYMSLSINANILDVNETWLSLLGYSRNEVIGHFIGNFITDNSLKTLNNSLECFKNEGPHDGIQFEFVCKNGTHRLLSVNGQIARDSMGNFLRTH